MGKTILTPTQYNFLELASTRDEITNWFFHAGGTALSEFYLHINEHHIDSFMHSAAKKLTDFPTMLVPFDKKGMEAYFLGLAKSLESKIFD